MRDSGVFSAASTTDSRPLPSLPSFTMRGRKLLPVVQGGMGVGISAHRLAGSVAACGALGTLSSVDLRRHHPDLMAATGHLKASDAAKVAINEANLVALDRELKAARELSGGRGALAVNVMRAVSEYAHYVLQACKSGADAVVVGAGLPLDLPELTSDFPDVGLIPILSDSRGIALVLKKWGRRGRLPDAIVIEHPKFAGGHLGAANVEDIDDPRFDFERVIPETLELMRAHGLGERDIPLIPAGGINSHERVRELLDLGASAVQLGSAFAVSVESDAHLNFKRVLANADEDDVVEFMSVAGLPARAVRTPWLTKHLEHEARKTELARKKPRCVMIFDCLIQCGLRDGIAKFGQFCIDRQLASALRGDVDKGLFFRGASKLPFGKEIRPVADLINYLMTGQREAVTVAA